MNLELAEGDAAKFVGRREACGRGRFGRHGRTGGRRLGDGFRLVKQGGDDQWEV